MGYIRPYRWLFISCLVLTLLQSILGPMKPLLMQRILDGPVANGDLSLLHQGIWLLLAATLLHVFSMYLQIQLTNLLGQRIINDLRQQVFRHLVGLKSQYFDKTPVGALQTRAISDTQTLSTVFSSTFVTIVGEIMQLGVIVGIMFYYNWRLTLVVLSVMPLIILSTWLFKRFVEGAFRRVRKYVSLLNSFTQEHITGMTVTQLYNRQEREREAFDELNTLHRKAHLDTVLAYSIFFPVVEILTALGTALLVWYGMGAAMEGFTSFGELTAFIMFINMFFRPIRQLADQFNTLQMGVVSAERVFTVLDTEEHIANAPKPGVDAQRIWTDPHIVFKDVHFAYNTDEPVLRGVSFEVKPGSVTAIVGATGSGKSTAIGLLMRLYERNSGEIRVAGEDVRDYDLYALRRSMGLVLQDVFLFSDSLFENIRLHNPQITRAQIMDAVARAGADRFIERLPGGLDYRVGERGSNLSTGQRQLISCLRVMVHNPAILLLDEATANIDSELEHLIQQALNTLLQNRTSLVVAHRLSTIQHADQILTMRKGEIIERGTHAELLKQDGYYRKLFLLQHGTALPAGA
ncbi:MAG: ABC transporter ATP-binding protein [Bacteroidetes bacterium]|nr:ABC transporter ATP-binding protein [Bacteroidota bacterium]